MDRNVPEISERNNQKKNIDQALMPDKKCGSKFLECLLFPVCCNKKCKEIFKKFSTVKETHFDFQSKLYLFYLSFVLLCMLPLCCIWSAEISLKNDGGAERRGDGDKVVNVEAVEVAVNFEAVEEGERIRLLQNKKKLSQSYASSQ